MKNLNILGQKIIRYIDNVRFLYDNTRIVCDSAYYNADGNWFDAYGNVVISKEKTKIYGDKLHFDGNTSVGELSGKQVRLVEEDALLVTNNLRFNSKTNYVYYIGGGVLTSKDSKLTSKRGYYDRGRSSFAFAGDVQMLDPDGTVYTDSLEYNSTSEVAYFFGPTFLFNEGNFAYCEKGWHNRKFGQSNLQKNAYILSGSNKLFGDAIFYDKANGYARSIGHVVVVDTTNKTYAYGDKANYWDTSKEAEITENPYVMMVDKTDTLFLRSDKLFVISRKDGNEVKNPKDSTYKVLKAIGNVKFFRNDIQGVCDSMTYNSLDSTLIMHVDPVMWNDVNQLSANLITVHSANRQIRQMDFEGAAFITSKEEEERFNQVAGKNIFAHFINGKLARMDVIGNGQTVYYMREDDSLTMVNRAESSNLTIGVKDNKVSRIVFREKPISNLYPIAMAEPEDVTLKGFRWLDSLRPKDKYAVIPKSLILFPDEKGKNRRMVLKPSIK